MRSSQGGKFNSDNVKVGFLGLVKASLDRAQGVFELTVHLEDLEREGGELVPADPQHEDTLFEGCSEEQANFMSFWSIVLGIDVDDCPIAFND